MAGGGKQVGAGAKLGNSNARYRGEFRDALRKCLGQDKTALRRIAQALINQATEGNLQAISLFAERLDGKSPQPIVGDDGHDPIRFSAALDVSMLSVEAMAEIMAARDALKNKYISSQTTITGVIAETIATIDEIDEIDEAAPKCGD